MKNIYFLFVIFQPMIHTLHLDRLIKNLQYAMTSHGDVLSFCDNRIYRVDDQSKNITNVNGTSIYVLKCENNKYYVGKTYDIDRRYNEHAGQNGSEWTKYHKPLKIIEQIDNCDDFDEDKYVLKYMSKYGIDNVRGGSFSTVNLDNVTKEYLQRMIRGSTDRCFKCGSTDHFVNDCEQDKINESNQSTHVIQKCYICKRNGHIAPQCYAKVDANGIYITHKQKKCCYRCGGDNHWVLNCKSDRDIFGAPCHYFTDEIASMIDDTMQAMDDNIPQLIEDLASFPQAIVRGFKGAISDFKSLFE
jgi:GIY-YIG catalytic domain-containing protein/zinc knuckle protein